MYNGAKLCHSSHKNNNEKSLLANFQFLNTVQNKRAIVVIRFYQTRCNKENGNDLEIYHMI